MNGSAVAVPGCVIEHRLSLRDVAAPPVLALGAWFKNTVCAVRDGVAVLSHSVGDLDRVEACIAHEHSARALLDWLGKPAAIAHDLHPDFHSSRHAAELAAELGVPAIAVQHHHAHLAAVCAEHRHPGPVLGLALDGVGLGSNGGIWGGELLQLDGAHCLRLGGLRPLALPGGDRAAREPWRMAAAALHALGRSAEIAERCGAHFSSPAAARAFVRMLDSGAHCPPSSSLGRLFDAAAGLLGLCAVMRFEAEAAIALEQAAAAAIATSGTPPPLPQGWQLEAGGDLDLRPLLAALADVRDVGQGAALFHVTLGAALFDWLQRAARQAGLATVAVGGGCLFNRLLAADLSRRCAAAGLQLLSPQRLLPGDSAIALGQAWVAQGILMEQS